MMEKSKSIEYGMGIWEEYPIEIRYDGKPERFYSCSHLEDGKLKTVIVVTNEGGSNITGICWECLKEKMEELGKTTNCIECGKAFAKTRKDQRYCSKKCGTRARMRNWRRKQKEFV